MLLALSILLISAGFGEDRNPSRLEKLWQTLKSLGWKILYYESEDKELWGNRGYIVYNPNIPEHKKKKITPPSLPPLPQPRMLSQEELEKIREEIRSAIEELNLARETRKEMEGYLKAIEEQLKAYKEKIEAGGETYTVRKGDSLWKISKKYYGTPFKWPLIYRANKDKIKDPNRIFPGQVLRIPPPSEEEIRPPLMHLK